MSIIQNLMNASTTTTEFGVVSWNGEDLRNALDVYGIEPSAENIEKLRGIMTADETLRSFKEKQIEAGWNFIYSQIEESEWD